MHASHALQQLTKLGVSHNSFGMGGHQLEANGTELIVDSRTLGVIGLVDVIRNYHRFRIRLYRLRKALKERRPDMLVIVDYPDFNLKLAKTATQLGIPVLFYISPQLWAWRRGRVKTIGKKITHMAVLFPFEVPFYRDAGIPVTFVGNPLVDDAVCASTKAEARKALSLGISSPTVALLPGSRYRELEKHLPVMLQAAKQIQQALPACQFVLPCAPSLDIGSVEQQIADAGIPVVLSTGQSYLAMRAADSVITASGTATLETALIGTPMCVVYIVSPLNYAIMSRLIEIDDIALVNIVAGKRVVQEFIQHSATPEAIASETLNILSKPEYHQQMCTELKKVKDTMGDGGASKRVAQLIHSMLA